MDCFLYNSGLRLEKVKKLSYRILIELFMYHESTLLIKHKLINLNWTANNLIVRNLLINDLNLIKESIQKMLLTEQMFFEIGAL